MDGKDITSTFKYDASSRKSAIDQIMEAQGANKQPKEISKGNFESLVGDTQQVGHRTWHEDLLGGTGKTGAQCRDDLLDGTKVDAGGTGARAFGSGIYITLTTPTNGFAPTKSALKAAQHDSTDYGYGNGKDAQVALTMSPSAKVIGAGRAKYLFKKEPKAIQQKFQNMSDGTERDTVNLWAAAKGYDAVAQNTWSAQTGQGYTYATLFNPTKTVVMDRKSTSSKYGGGEGTVRKIR